MRFVLGVLLLIVVFPAWAEWIEIGRGDGNTLYVDKTTIQKAGQLAKMWVMVSFETPKRDRKSNQSLSQKFLYESDCRNERQRILAFTYYSGRYGEGSVVNSASNIDDEWSPNRPGSIIEISWRIACGKK